MRVYKCDRCKKEMNEADIYKIFEFRKRELNNIDEKIRYDFCSMCANDWDTLMISVSDAFLEHKTIRIEEAKENEKDSNTI